MTEIDTDCPFCGRPYDEHDRSCTEEIDEIPWNWEDDEQ